MENLFRAVVRFEILPLPPEENLAALWGALEQAGRSSIFTSWLWIGTWLRTLPRELEPRLLRAVCDGETVACAILIQRRSWRVLTGNLRQLHFNSSGDQQFDCIAIEHNGFVGEREVLPHFVRWFAEGGADADELVIPGVSVLTVPPEDGLLHVVRRVQAFANRNLGYGDFAAGLSRNARQQLNRSLRGFARLGFLRIEQAKDVPSALAYLDALKMLHVRYWDNKKKPHAFRWPYFEKFHRELIASALPNGAVQMLRVSAGSHIVGYLYNLRRKGHVYAYQSGFDYTDRSLRPGYVSHAMAIDYNNPESCNEYDFLAGDNRLKRAFASSEYTMEWHKFSRPTLRLRFEAMVKTAAQRFRPRFASA